MGVSVKLAQILYDREITRKQDARFLWEFQRTVLLALNEDGSLTDVQLRYAEEKLKEQYRAAIREQNGEQC